MLKEGVLKLHNSTVDRRNFSTVPNKESTFVDVVKFLSLPESLYNGDYTDRSAV